MPNRDKKDKMISTSALGMAFGSQILFQNVSLRLDAGQRYGLVGANGSGKTTLLNILAGHQDPTEGSVSLAKRMRLGTLRQDQFLHDEEEILAVTMMGNRELWEALVAKEALLARADTEFDTQRYAELEEVVLRHDGYAAEARAAEILEGLGLPNSIHQDRLSTLSGGFKLRVLLAQVLAGSPDALLLDEPTNHLDIVSIRWLEKFLLEFAGPVLVISHDHRFLDNVCTQILDIDYQTVTPYKGNYTQFIEAKVAERERREKEIAHREREIAHHQKFVDRFRAKASKARQAQSRARIIEKKAQGLEKLPASSRRYPNFRFGLIRRSGQEVLNLADISKFFGDKQVLEGVNLTLLRGDRLAIMGPNGIGKSTLLKIFMGELEASGGRVEWGYETYPGYFAQDPRRQLNPNHQTAEGWIGDAVPGETIGFIRNQLAQALFSGEEAQKRLSALSGGEATRLVFCRLAVQQPNVLVLDEPTNHLDLESIESLVKGLKQYAGTLVFVSHDRWFVSQLATRVVEIKPTEILDYRGSYEEYVHYCGDDHLDRDQVVLKVRREKKKKRKNKAAASGATTGKQAQGRQRLQQLTNRRGKLVNQVEAAEARVREINELFCDPLFCHAAGHTELGKLEMEQKRLLATVEQLMDEWQAVEEELARISHRGAHE